MAGVTSVVIDGTSYLVDDINAVDFSEDQGLSEQQQQQGRSNIGAAAETALADLVSEAEFTEALTDKANVIVDTASGAIASFPDGAAVAAKDITIGIDPVQDLHGYDHPWPGGATKNLLNPSVFDDYKTGVTYISYPVNNGTYTISSPNYPNVGGVTNVFFLPGNVSSGASTWTNGVWNIQPRTITVTDGYYTVAYRSTSEDNTNNPKNFKWQIELGSTVTDYIPYSNICPISGWTGANVTACGVNLLDPDGWTSGARINISNGGVEVTSPAFYAHDYIDVNPNTTYTCNWSYYSSGNFGMAFYDKNKTYLSGIKQGDITSSATEPFTFTTPANARYIRVSASAGFSDAMQINVGSSASAYKPYNANTVSISWQSVAGTVYGGTLDVTTGLLTVTHGNIANYNGESLPSRWISSMDVYSAGGTPTSSAQVVYELATPQTYHLSPTEVTFLLGYNNVWADTGDTTVTYRADTKLYIQKINTPTDDDMIADAQIASGKYFIIGGNLYRSTTTIPAGDAITPGTNCILTNLADALNALNT